MSATLNGLQCASARLTLPLYGAWIADMEIAAAEDAPSGRCSLVIGDMTLSGTVFRSIEHAGNTRVRVVGGAGKWGKAVAPRGYKSPAGLQLAPILQDAARDAGEALGAIPAQSVGSWYSRRRGAASQVFALLPSGTSWWVDDAGVTQVGARSTGTISTPLDVMSCDGFAGVATIAADELSPIRPGRTLSHPTLDSARVIDTVIWHVMSTELRGEVWLQ